MLTLLISILPLLRNPKIWLVAGVLVGLGVTHYKAYDAGVDRTVAKYEAIQNQRSQLVDKVVSDLRERIKKQEEDNAKLQTQLQENTIEASKDPLRDRPSLSRDSVRRLNRIK